VPQELVPKPVPVSCTTVVMGPDTGEMAAICGITVKSTPLLFTPPTVTTTLPVVAALGTGTAMLVPVELQFVGVPGTPLNITVLLP
jgi:hypothetical protein